MTLFENPLQLDREVRDLSAAESRWQLRLQSGDIDESGPFFGKPALTERDAFRIISELAEPEPVRRAWARWAFRLTDARVNAHVRAALAQTYRVDVHLVEEPDPVHLTLRAMLMLALERPRERALWLSAFGANAAQYRRWALAAVVRRNEVARRAGFASDVALTWPAAELLEFARRLLAATDDSYRELVPNALAPWLDTALATAADQGWPAQLNPRTVRQLLGGTEWFEGLALPARTLPQPIAASSFVRGLYELGAAIQLGAAPKRELFVTARDPYGLYRHTVGCLTARLATLPRWHMDVLGVSRARATEQARTMLVAQLIAVRTRALALIVEDCVRRGDGNGATFEELSHAALGFALPPAWFGAFPRLRADSGQRLIAPWLASQWADELTNTFDVDWFRNPRGIESIRDRLSRVSPNWVEADELGTALQRFVASLHAGF